MGLENTNKFKWVNKHQLWLQSLLRYKSDPTWSAQAPCALLLRAGAACTTERVTPPWDSREVAAAWDNLAIPAISVPGQAHIWLVQLCQSHGSHETVTPQSGNYSSFWRHHVSPAVKVCWKSSGGGILRFWFKCSLREMQPHSRELPGRGVWENKVITNMVAKKLNGTCHLWIWSLPFFLTEKKQQRQPGDRNQ